MSEVGGNYSSLDRAIHRLAFASAGVQETAADIEALLYGKSFQHLPVSRPIFVTSLPRAGTTLVLELLARVPGIATHTYRDMPFVMSPILWDAVSRRFHKPSDLRERAHGDGMAVGYDSPEAFEEIVWRTFWPTKYGVDRIALWSDNESASEFLDVFTDHIRRILAVRAQSGQAGRYASKNNANVSRLGLLRRLFPDGVLLVPFRDPVGQAVSLLQQHVRFGERHVLDPFARQYMDDIGHLEFGALHRPIHFEGMDAVRAQYSPDALDYWLAYWERAFRHVLKYSTSIALMSYEALCALGPAGMPPLAERLDVPEHALIAAIGNRMRPPREHTSDKDVKDLELLRRCRELHQELADASIIRSVGARA
jgi:hypothetical protein